MYRPTELRTREYANFWRDAKYDNLEMLHAKFITHAFTRHYHEEYVVGVIVRGSYEFYHRGEMVKIREGEVVVINPGELHSGQAYHDKGWTYRTMYPSITLMRRIAAEITEKNWEMPFFQQSVIHDPYLAQQLQALHLLFEQSHSQLARDTQLRIVLGTLISRHAINRSLSVMLATDQQVVRQVRDYLHEHYAENVSLDDLAEVAGLSPYHLVRVFKKEMGLPPHQYLAHLRVLRAKAMLSSGEAIGKVATATGFTDQSHLTRWFKRVMGIPPGKYAR